MGKAKLGSLGLVAALATSPRDAVAGLEYVYQERSTAVTVGQYTTAKYAPDDQTFDAEVSRDSVSASGDPNHARVPQHSILGDDGIRANGHIDAGSGLDLTSYKSVIDVTFDVSTPTSYQLNAALNFDGGDGFQFHPNGHLGVDTIFDLSLTQVGTGDVLLSHQCDTMEVFNRQRCLADGAGVLPPDQYRLRLVVYSTQSEDYDIGDYRVDFRTADGGTPPPTEVPLPLPPAAWAGLLTLGGLAGGQGWAARRRRLAAA